MTGLATDLEVLRRLPSVLVTSGYVDALLVRGLFAFGAVEADLEHLAPPAATLVRLFALHRDVPREELEHVLAGDEVEALVRLGVLVPRAGGMSSGNLVALPLLGQLAWLPSPPSAPTAYFGDDVAALLVRAHPTTDDALVLGAGPGLLALRAAATARRVVAVERDPIALGCAELNAAMNGLTDRIELRSTPPDPSARFARVLAIAPPSPVPIRDAPDGPEVAARMLHALADLLAPDGIAQLTATFHGDDAGPRFAFDIDRFVAERGLRVVVTIPSRQSLAAGQPLFESLAARAARTDDARRAWLDHLAARGALWLYLAILTVSRTDRPSVEVTRHHVRPGGSWSR